MNAQNNRIPVNAARNNRIPVNAPAVEQPQPAAEEAVPANMPFPQPPNMGLRPMAAFGAPGGLERVNAIQPNFVPQARVRFPPPPWARNIPPNAPVNAAQNIPRNAPVANAARNIPRNAPAEKNITRNARNGQRAYKVSRRATRKRRSTRKNRYSRK